jgi:hypothetical protein
VCPNVINARRAIKATKMISHTRRFSLLIARASPAHQKHRAALWARPFGPMVISVR